MSGNNIKIITLVEFVCLRSIFENKQNKSTFSSLDYEYKILSNQR